MRIWLTNNITFNKHINKRYWINKLTINKINIVYVYMINEWDKYSLNNIVIY